MNYRISLFFVLGILTNSQLMAQPTIIPGGDVSGTWMKSASPYQVTGDITIAAGSTLTIEPGVEVLFQGYYSLGVNGSLVSKGTEVDSILFYPSDINTGWKGITLAAIGDSSWITYSSIRYGSKSDGGGINCTSPKAVISHCTISDNIGTNNGGGISINTGLTNPAPEINNCVVSRNSARFGGGVYYSAKSMIISECVISNNSATNSTDQANGGGIFFAGGISADININNCIIQNNSCESDPSDASTYGLGGGIFINGRNSGGISISNCEILDNWSTRSGGGIYVNLGTPVITDCTIRGNSTRLCYPDISSLLGGAAISFEALSDNSVISHCEISENSGYGYSGGAIRAYQSIAGSLTLENCTVTRNYSITGAGAIYFDGSLILRNTIVAFNQGSIAIDAASPDFAFCDFYGNEGSDGEATTTNANGDPCDAYSNIFLDPMFADTANSNYQITWASFPTAGITKSPCIDAGDPALPNDPDVTVADIGRFFFNQDIPTYIETDYSESPEGYILNQAYPNPFQSVTTIAFDLPEMSDVTLFIFNNLGEVVVEKIYGKLFPGRYEYKWDAVTMPAGVYFYRLRSDKYDITKKMILLR